MTAPLIASPRGNLRLLVVDDEAIVRRNLVRALRGRGFSPEEAPDGHLAAEMIRNTARPYDMVITDIVMPGMDGFALAELTKTLSPTTQILLISAYAPEPDGRWVDRWPFLQKPFDLSVFVGTVCELLNSWTPPESFPSIMS